jgi:hypothetical protein
MRKFILLCAALFTMVLSLAAGPVQAQLWVGPNGSDANPCTQTQPCATFQQAISRGATQIDCLGSGSYGRVIITGSLSIDCGAGNVGNIVDDLDPGVTINTSSDVTVTLRHLAITGLGSTAEATDGIRASSFAGGTLIVEDCTVYGYPRGSGIFFETSLDRGTLQVSNSRFFGNVFGIQVAPAANKIASVTLDQVQLTGNLQYGLALGGAGVIAGAMNNSIVGTNTLDGVIAAAGQVYFTINQSIIVANLANGVHTNSAGTNMNVSASTITGNGTGVLASTGALVSFGDNHMNSNAVDGNFTSTKALK